MIDRYTREPMGKIWSLKNQYESWLQVEIAIDEAWSRLGKIPKSDVEKIKKNAKFDPDEIGEIEKTTHHDVVAFIKDVSKSLGDEQKWIHFGVTSTDVVDTAYGYRYHQANQILKEDLKMLTDTIAKKAVKYKDTVMIGRTHGVQAEPTTWGLKLARWYSMMKRNIKRFDQVSKEVEAGKVSGAVGTFANIPPEIEKYVCEKLDIHPQEISSQVLPRDLHADYISTLALIGTSLEDFATEIRSLQRSEIHEVEEHFGAGQKGSSAMPHKRNPVGSENITGLARVMRGHVITAYEDVSLWHERDISHSSAERIIVPDTTILLDYMLHRFNNILDNLTVFPERMRSNLYTTHGLIFSQRVMLKLIDSGLTRTQAYGLVQPLTSISWSKGSNFKDLVLSEPTIREHLSKDDINDAFDYHYHIRNANYIMKRVGLLK